MKILKDCKHTRKLHPSFRLLAGRFSVASGIICSAFKIIENIVKKVVFNEDAVAETNKVFI